MNAELIIDCQNQLGEGPVWDYEQQQLYWVDFDACTVFVFDPVTEKLSTIRTKNRVMVVIPTNTRHLLLAQERSVQIYDPENEKIINSRELDVGWPDNRCNDGKCDAQGNLWIGTMNNQAKPGAGSLYRLGAGLTEHRMLKNLTVPNGLAWSNDGRRFYHIDSHDRCVQCFNTNPTTDGLDVPIFSFDTSGLPGLPDGMTIDAEGKLWIAQWGGACVGRWDPGTGQLLHKISVPAALTTSCTFGGENYDTLYITSSRKYARAEELAMFPLSGGLFAVKPGVNGGKANFFKE